MIDLLGYTSNFLIKKIFFVSLYLLSGSFPHLSSSFKKKINKFTIQSFLFFFLVTHNGRPFKWQTVVLSFQRSYDRVEDFHTTRKLNLEWENASVPTFKYFLYIQGSEWVFSSTKDGTAQK